MKQTAELHLPFEGEWLTFWGGDTSELNHHHANASQRYAFDFIQVDESGKFYRTDGTSNEDYYSFGKDVLAPADGVVLEAVDGVRDNKPRDINTYSVLGNYMLIKHTESELSLIAHFKNGSILVKAGDTVTVGQKIAECGNSGNSSDPHLHYQLQDADVFASLNDKYEQTNIARGIKVCFSNVQVNGVKHNSYSPTKGDTVRPTTSYRS